MNDTEIEAVAHLRQALPKYAQGKWAIDHLPTVFGAVDEKLAAAGQGTILLGSTLGQSGDLARYIVALHNAAIAAVDAHRATVPDAVRELTEAIRLTVEYAGNDLLPAIPGWSWYDALVKYAPDVAQAFVDKPVHLTPTREPHVKPDEHCGRGVCAANAGHAGTCAEASGWAEPTVKPDTSIVVGQQMCKPDRESLAKAALEGLHETKHGYRFNPEIAADAVLALLPGKTEREVAEAAWDEGRQSLALDMGNPLREDMTRESTANPYRAKGASDD